MREETIMEEAEEVEVEAAGTDAAEIEDAVAIEAEVVIEIEDAGVIEIEAVEETTGRETVTEKEIKKADAAKGKAVNAWIKTEIKLHVKDLERKVLLERKNTAPKIKKRSLKIRYV